MSIVPWTRRCIPPPETDNPLIPVHRAFIGDYAGLAVFVETTVLSLRDLAEMGSNRRHQLLAPIVFFRPDVTFGLELSIDINPGVIAILQSFDERIELSHPEHLPERARRDVWNTGLEMQQGRRG